jgi:hypothetical protein
MADTLKAAKRGRLHERNVARRLEEMANRKRFIPTVIAAALFAVCLPLVASAQGS